MQHWKAEKGQETRMLSSLTSQTLSSPFLEEGDESICPARLVIVYFLDSQEVVGIAGC